MDIGGSVINEQGEPIPDVRVVFSVSGSAPGASHDRERLTMMGDFATDGSFIVRKELRLKLNLSQILQILSVNVFEQMPLAQLVTQTQSQTNPSNSPNQLMLWH